MLKVRVRLHRFKIPDSMSFQEDQQGYIHINLPSNACVQDLFNMLDINPIGKVVLINGSSCTDYGRVITDESDIEIFQLMAGG